MRLSKHNLWFVFIALIPGGAIAGESAVTQLMRDGGAVLLIRHARAPGIGDPEDFKLDDCSTQRNLDEQGRAQARAIGCGCVIFAM